MRASSAILCFLISTLVCPVSGNGASPVVSIENSVERFQLTIGGSITLSTDKPVERASLANPEVADILIISPTQIYLRGNAPGLTNLSLWWANGNGRTVYDLEISPDISQLKKRLCELLPEEKNIQVTTNYDAVTLTGSLSNIASLPRVLALAESYAPERVKNLLQISGVHQVMLEVQIAEISRSAERDLGIQLGRTWGKGAPRASSASDLFNITVSPALTSNLVFHRGYSTWTAIVDTLEEKGLAKILAEPTLIALSGQEANFLVGGEIPIPVQTETGISVEYKEYGIGVTFTPTVLNSKKISMRVSPEVSELDYENAISIAGAMVPGLTIRQASTVVELGDGQSFAIAGLIKEVDRETINKFPILGDIPILGALFRSSGFDNAETELVIIVTPHLVQPLDMAKQTLPTDKHIRPGDIEFFLLGALEGREKKSSAGNILHPEKDSGLDGEFGHILPMTGKNEKIEGGVKAK